jgi:hypothetical protein
MGEEYFKHCPFCGSVEVDFDMKTFRCPGCGAVVTFELPRRQIDYADDRFTDTDRIAELWNRREGNSVTADDLCVKAQRVYRDQSVVYQDYIRKKVWRYIYDSAELGKPNCEIPAKLIPHPEEYKEKNFSIKREGLNYQISWDTGIEWD